MKSEMKYEEEEIFLRTVVGHGLERDDLRDEIYVMCKMSGYFQGFELHLSYFFLNMYSTVYEQYFARYV